MMGALSSFLMDGSVHDEFYINVLCVSVSLKSVALLVQDSSFVGDVVLGILVAMYWVAIRHRLSGKRICRKT